MRPRTRHSTTPSLSSPKDSDPRRYREAQVYISNQRSVIDSMTKNSKELQTQFDHTLTIDRQDPLLPLFEELHKQGGCDLRVMDGVGIEKVSEWCFNAANNYIKETTEGRCWVSKVEVWEHDKNSAIYTE